MFSYINIIGYGYVGGSMGFLCKNRGIKFTITDNLYKKNNGEEIFFHRLGDTIQESERTNDINYYFVCVPTPTVRDEYTCDVSIVESVVDIIGANCSKKSIVIIKSTVVPGTTRKINLKNKNPNVSIFFCPEFLTELNAENDVMNEKKVIVGCSDEGEYEDVYSLMSKLYNSTSNVKFCLYEYAETMKYTINTYLAQKIFFFNGINEVCEKLDISYNKLIELVLLDTRISESHTKVPGPDGRFGFGGSCLTKETKGMISLRDSLGLNTDYITSMLNENFIFRLKNKEDLRSRYYKNLAEEAVASGLIFPQETFNLRIGEKELTLKFTREELTSIIYGGVIYTYHGEEGNSMHFKSSDTTLSILAGKTQYTYRFKN